MKQNVPGAAPAPSSRPKYVRAVGPRLRALFYFLLGLLGLLGINSLYLVAVTGLEWFTQQTVQDYFYQCMFLLHLGLGLLLIGPFVAFGFIHMVTSWNRRNRRAIRIGYALLVVSIVVLLTGVLLMRVGRLDLKQPIARSVVYWLHIITPLFTIWLYWLHRLAGPRIKWRVGLSYAVAGAAVVALMVVFQSQDPRRWNVIGPKEGEQYFRPSLARTASGNFIPPNVLMSDDYCLKCHEDSYRGWFHSAHHISSFNNPAYLATVRETREVALKRDGNVKAARWCAGCHDPVPFFSGAFDDPKYDDVRDPTAHAGITCTICHSITNINSTRGNADYTIEEPIHYPFTYSTNPVLQFINNQMVKAKPTFHKKTFLKPFHKTAEFCSTCHKVHLPKELTHYKEFLRGQNHYDTYLLSGVSGHGARSFYYPDEAKTNCSACHMPLQSSVNDFSAKDFDRSGKLSIHNHLFPAANTALAYLRNEPEIVKAHQEFLKGIVRVDIFGVHEGGTIDGKLVAPLRPEVPALAPGNRYLLDAVVRTLKMGHPLTQGTVDSNELWLDVTVTSGGRVIGRSGGLNELGAVDPWSHFLNVFMLDRDGNRINRRNPQDIFVPLYNHQIPPGAAQVAHYEIQVPEDVREPVTVEIKLQYRKFDQEYMDFVTRTARPGDVPIRDHEPGKTYVNQLPITTLAVDRLTFPVAGGEGSVENAKVEIPVWQRWNDYGIGLLLEGQGGARGELRQAADAFAEVEKLGRFDGPVNLGRVYNLEGRLDEAVAAIERATKFTDPPAPVWTVNWLTGLVNRQQGRLEEAEKNFRSVLEDRSEAMVTRKFDFSMDYEVINELGLTLFEQAKQKFGDSRKAERQEKLEAAVAQFEKTLKLDPENVAAHYNLQLLYQQLGNTEKANEHQVLHAKYKPDDNARDRAIALARQKYPAADHAAEVVVIYPLQRDGAPGLQLSSVTPAEPSAQTESGGEE